MPIQDANGQIAQVCKLCYYILAVLAVLVALSQQLWQCTYCWGYAGVDASKAWITLRDMFRSIQRKYQCRMASRAGAVAEPTWKFWHLFDFLKQAEKKAR